MIRFLSSQQVLYDQGMNRNRSKEEEEAAAEEEKQQNNKKNSKKDRRRKMMRKMKYPKLIFKMYVHYRR